MVITFKDVSFRYTDKNLLDKVSFSITDQDKTGLVGLNGTGKSTLIKLIEDEIRPQSGEIIKSGNMIISYLEQEPDIPLNTKILDYVMKNNDKDHKVNDYEAKSMLTKLKLDPEALTNNLSGGQRKRLALAKCLVTYCDFLILDEPTNHLDNDMILYLEKYLQRYNHGLFMVTHDRYFLERVCNNMLELDNGHIYTYKANYSEFLNLKALRLEREEKAEKKLKRLLKNELDWIHRGVEARRTKQKYRIERFNELSKIKFSERKGFEFDSVSKYLGKTIISSSWASRILPCRQASWPALPLRWRAMLYLTEEVPAMPVNEFLVLWLSSWAAIAFFRIAPAFALRGRTLSPRITEALSYIPPAAFAALVANDLVSPGAFDAGLWPALVPWIAAVGVVVVAVKTKSMLWCCVSGIVLYIVLSLI